MSIKKLAMLTYGCQMNKYDSERIVGLLAQADYELTEDVSRGQSGVAEYMQRARKGGSKIL